MYKIQTLNEISDIIHSQLSADEYTVTRDEPVPDAILVRSADMQSMELPESLIAIARAGAGVNNIPIDNCSKKGIVVFNTPGANANAVAELVMAGLLLCSRDIAGGIQWAATLKGQGEAVVKLVEKGKNQFVGPELRGKTLGVIGLGAIGALVANSALNGLGMDVIGLDPFISVEHAWSLSRAIKRASTLEELLQKSDYVSVHIPLTPKTKNMFDTHLFGIMKNGARLLNFSRAELVDGEACRQALKEGKLSGYVTDFPTDDMLGVPGVVCIPHLGASTPESEENCARMAAAQIRDYLETGTIRNSVNMPEIMLSGQPEGCRILLIHDNVPNMVSNMSAAISREGININNMINKSRQEMAVTVMELSQVPTEELIAELNQQPGVIKVRCWH
jgi:D-3-phosphoglycerate dehydrogenase / 2-oxoglutarate reductase